MDTKPPRTVTEMTAVVVSEAMTDAGLTVLGVADRTGIPRTTLTRRLSGGSPFTVAEVDTLAAVVGVPVSVIIARAEDRLVGAAA